MPIDPNAAVAAQNQQIQSIYDNLGKNLQQGVKATGDIFGAAHGALSGDYNQGLSDLGAIADRLNARLGQSANALGLNAAVSGASQGIEGALANAAARMAGNKTAGLGALDNQGTAYSAIAQRGVGDSAREGTRVQVESANKLKRALYDYMGQEEASKGKVDVQRLANQANLQKMQMDNEARKLQTDAQIRQMQVSQQSQASARNYQLAQAAAQRQYQMDNPLNQLKAEYIGSQIDKNSAYAQHLLNGSGQYGSGQPGLDQFLSEQGISPKDPTAQLIQQTINDATLRAQQEQQQGHNVSPYELAMADIANLSENGLPEGVDPGLYTTGIQINYGKARRGR